MYPRRKMTTFVAMLAAILLAVGMSGGGPPVFAAAQQATGANMAKTLPLYENTKAILPETSIDGPALASIWTASAPSEAVLAWTGTDPNHHLNVEISSDGATYSNKVTLNETSSYRPDAALATVGGAVVVAWTGTDAHHSLNVIYDVYGTYQKLTLWNESSIAAPSIIVGPGMYLAWTGTDTNHSLNIMPLSATSSGLVAGQKTILPMYTSDTGPILARRGANTLVLNWAAPTLEPFVATSQDAVHWTSTSLSSEYSTYAPDTNSLEPYIGVSGHEWIGWTGIDAQHHLNLQYTTTFPSFTNPGNTLTITGETAYNSPSLSYFNGLQVAWTGTDPAHHLNVGTFSFTKQATGYPVQVYFSKHPDSDNNFASVFAVKRTSPDLGVATYAVQQLISGPTAAEQQQGYFTELTADLQKNDPSSCGGADFKLTMDHRGLTPETGTATLQFCRTILSGGIGADARMGAELQATLTQFPTIKHAVILNKQGNCFGDQSTQNACLKSAAAFQVTGVTMSVNPTSITGKTCGTPLTVVYTATFAIAPDGPGGTIEFTYTTNNGRGENPATLAVGAGKTTATYTFQWSGALPADHAYPAPGGVMVTSPNALTSQLIAPTGSCS